MEQFLQGIVNIFNNVVSAFETCFDYVTAGVDTLMETASVFPSLFNILPSGYTGLIVALLSVSLFVGLLCHLLRKV